MTSRLYALTSTLILMLLAVILVVVMVRESLKRKPSIDKIAAFDLAFFGGAM